MELAATYAYTMGVTVAAEAGNSGRAGVLCPAVVPSVLAIAAVDAGRQSAPFSAYGPEVDLAAPGLNIYSTLPTAVGSYGYKSGTSMATPYVAGAAALLMGQPGFDTPDKIRAALEGSALGLGHVAATHTPASPVAAVCDGGCPRTQAQPRTSTRRGYRGCRCDASHPFSGSSFWAPATKTSSRLPSR